MNWIEELAKDKYKPIDKNLEIALIKEYQNGNKESGKKVINANLRYVAKLCAKFTQINTETFNDLIQSSIIGMYKALDSYNPEFNVKFLTFAYKYIFHEIYEVLTSNLTILSVPNSVKRIIVALYRLIPDLQTELGRDPTIEEIINELKKRTGSEKINTNQIINFVNQYHLVYPIDYYLSKEGTEELDPAGSF